MTETTEITYRTWACRACRRTYKVQPEVFKPDCRCKNPVPSLRPCLETQVSIVPRRNLRLVSAREEGT